MSGRKSIWEWAVDYVGDPSSWSKRGQLITTFLQEEGMTRESHVLDIGCGNLSEGAPLINLLQPGHFVGLEPNGWLVEAALEHMPELEHKAPVFLHRSDFDASEADRRFDYVVAHSVLSHAAHWQLDQFLTTTRAVVDDGAVMLVSFIEDQYNSFSEQWQYPGVSTFRLRTIMAAGYYTGWNVRPAPDLRERLVAECPDDTHQWLRCTATLSMAQMNEERLAEEDLQNKERRRLEEVERVRLDAARATDEEMVRAAGMNA